MTTPTENPAPTASEIEAIEQWSRNAKIARAHETESENPDTEKLARLDHIIAELDAWLADPTTQRPWLAPPTAMSST